MLSSKNKSQYFEKDNFMIPVKIPSYSCNFTVNLAGLTNNLNYKLLKLRKRSKIEITTTVGQIEKKYTGEVYDVGIDFVELRTEDGLIVIILKEHISQIHFIYDAVKEIV